ncbi:hypothetical protein L1987_64757 [Smallanthus sonchifolius]|uniref:Uncharacterized protein n=1 Tax=Smallanthus sonchifolius TaxID=185202 RepID=A0ACB9BSL6_9ASTR|nr:hypothetical protein L1987_64757 [Smallanthus sonchifolius]
MVTCTKLQAKVVELDVEVSSLGQQTTDQQTEIERLQANSSLVVVDATKEGEIELVMIYKDEEERYESSFDIFVKWYDDKQGLKRHMLEDSSNIDEMETNENKEIKVIVDEEGARQYAYVIVPRRTLDASEEVEASKCSLSDDADCDDYPCADNSLMDEEFLRKIYERRNTIFANESERSVELIRRIGDHFNIKENIELNRDDELLFNVEEETYCSPKMERALINREIVPSEEVSATTEKVSVAVNVMTVSADEASTKAPKKDQGKKPMTEKDEKKEKLEVQERELKRKAKEEDVLTEVRKVQKQHVDKLLMEKQFTLLVTKLKESHV